MATSSLKAKRIFARDIESRLEAAGMIGENTAMKFLDIYGANMQAVNEIFDV